jgi:squalene-hopene/tetraprenyl-beta-curcumene cyclase
MQLVTNNSAIIDRSTVASALAKATGALLAARNPEGVWTGELSSSALSTATAVTALTIFDQNSPKSQSENSELITAGLNWLAEHGNLDGGWGDTIQSNSNLSTTLLCWAAFQTVPGAAEPFASVIEAANTWLERNAGGTEPNQIAEAILERYGKDRTFSVPILTVCALTGRLGHASVGWKSVVSLPFELAALPRSWFGVLKLPVVSYALPALIAIGQARHHHCPSGNPITRLLRALTRKRTLKVLAEIQPSNGGFLEATPLTSFVAMSLAGSGQAGHIVTRRAIDFLRRSIRPDGSWPIDTDLSTWVTTLSVNALCEPVADQESAGPLTPEDRHYCQRWLLKEQRREIHPYTNAPGGGWAWTDKPGGVPDADDTAGALVAIGKLEWAKERRLNEGMLEGLEWLLKIQNSDGGIPTFCRGWGNLPFDRSSPDLTAHAIRAWATWLPACEPPVRQRIEAALQRAVKYVFKAQEEDGSWIPLWFGNQHASDETNPTYGTSRVLQALIELIQVTERKSSQHRKLVRAISRGIQWLVDAQHRDGSWGGCVDGPPSVEETSLAVHCLARALAIESAIEISGDQVTAVVRRGTSWLIARVQDDTWSEPSAIGFYFAKLWYFEKVYPLAFTVAALRAVDRLLAHSARR